MENHLQALRDGMAEHNLDAYLLPTADFHGSEYVGAHFAGREYVSGFTGSAGTLLVFPTWAGLWTDGRYFLQAQEQLAGSGIRLMKMGQPGVPSIEAFLRSSLQAEQALGFDGRCVSAQVGKRLHTLAGRIGARVNDRIDLLDEIWLDRPPRSARPARSLPLAYAGEDRLEKLARVRQAVRSQGSDVLILTSLEDIAWLLNIRGDDIPCTPVVLAYLALTPTGCDLFAAPAAFSPELRDELAMAGVTLRPYEGFYRYLNHLSRDQKVQLDLNRVNTRVLTSIPTGVSVRHRPDPTLAMKAVKNVIETENFRRAHLDDGVALTRFMYWLKTRAGKEPITELSAAEKLEELRRASEDYLQPSFDPILAYGPHSAVIHYSATEETNVEISDAGFLLADTGGHYLTGTTDCTRTYALGPVTQEQKAHYTAVLRGNLNLAAARFKAGCTGPNLDYLARQPLWDLGLDFNHGTGHGVGYLLSVHEGPQAIRWRTTKSDVPLEPGMVTSDEPGVYFDGCYGIRLENLVLCTQAGESEYGQFLAFETLTLTPFDLDAIDPGLMTQEERDRLNAYHARVRETLLDRLPPEEQPWLIQATRPVPPAETGN